MSLGPRSFVFRVKDAASDLTYSRRLILMSHMRT